MQNASQPRGRGWRRAGKPPRRGRALARPPEGFLARGGVSTHGCPSPVRTQPRDGQPPPACQLLTAVALGPPRGLWLRWQEPRWWHSPHLHPHHRPTSPSSPRGCVSLLREQPPGASSEATALPSPPGDSAATSEAQLGGEAAEQTCKKKKKSDSDGDFSGRGGTVSAAFCFVFLR